MKRFAAFLGGAAALVLLIVMLGASSIGPWPIAGTLPVSQQGYSPAGNGSLAMTGTSTVYLSSGGSAATSVPCNSVTLAISTSAASLYASGGGTNGLILPSGTVLTLSASNLNTLKLSGGSTSVVTYMYSN